MHYYKVELVKSDIDSNFYLVRDVPDKQYASNMLAKISINMTKLNNYLSENKKKFPKYEKYINQLNDKLKNTKIQESTDNGIYTSYSVNKGEQIVFCLRSRKINNGKLHDLNLLMYVVLHEMAHVACPEYGHTDLFKDIFAFLTTEAVNINIYTKINFKNDNREYCGLTITDSII
jgi:predicted metal-dependent hydrolase